jgi:AraC-like DNA-binding protein
MLAMLDRTQQTPHHRFPLVDTRRPDEFRETLITTFGAHVCDVGAAPAAFHARRSYCRVGKIDLIFGACSAPYRVHFPGSALVKQHFVLQMSGRTRFGGNQFDLSCTESPVIPSGIEMMHEYDAGFEQFLFRVDGAALQTKLSAITGRAIIRPIEFMLPRRSTNPALPRLRRMLDFMLAELAHDEISAAALVEFEQLVIVSFLAANRHNFSDLIEREQPRPAPWQVRVVEDFIEANWNQPITVEVLAAAAGASARSIFKAFREARQCSPMAFVKGIRLSHARAMLEHPEQPTSVISVAFSCGFLNPGHFARDYRLAFGELPSVTLPRARHRRH